MGRLRFEIFTPLPLHTLLLILLTFFFFLESFSVITSSKCTRVPKCSLETELLVLVKSLPSNFDLRRIIRSTWANTTLGARVRLVFVLIDNKDDESEERKMLEEDVLRSEPGSSPSLAGLAWSGSFCPQVPRWCDTSLGHSCYMTCRFGGQYLGLCFAKPLPMFLHMGGQFIAPHKGKNCMLSLFLTLTPGPGHCSDGGNAIFGSVCVCHFGHPLAHRATSALSSCPRREAAPCSEPVVDATHKLVVQPDSSQLLCLWILHVQPGDRQEAAQSISNFAAASRWRALASIDGGVGNEHTLPPERTQPKKLCTANFSSGTLKTLIDGPLWLKNKIF